MNFLRTSILFLMLYLIYTRAITVGQFFSLFIYSFFIFGPLQELGNVINIYRETEASLNNYEDILNMPKEPQPGNPRPLQDAADAGVRARQLPAPVGVVAGGRATSRSRSQRGETIAFVGPSGAGKTTLVKLLVGLYRARRAGDPLQRHLRRPTIDLDELRERIGFVTQDTQLFSGTIRENLLFVNPTRTDAECLEVLRKAACDSLLARADKGLDTVIGEGGVKVSGGEKQRLSIARALLRRPHLLVFDEATSSLDSLTEEGIVETIRDVAASGDVITILIAHRLSTILHADRIYVLERGRIVETGRHDELRRRRRGCTTRCGGSRSASGAAWNRRVPRPSRRDWPARPLKEWAGLRPRTVRQSRAAAVHQRADRQRRYRRRRMPGDPTAGPEASRSWRRR